jgi:hypothetical protein
VCVESLVCGTDVRVCVCVCVSEWVDEASSTTVFLQQKQLLHDGASAW